MADDKPTLPPGQENLSEAEYAELIQKQLEGMFGVGKVKFITPEGALSDKPLLEEPKQLTIEQKVAMWSQTHPEIYGTKISFKDVDEVMGRVKTEDLGIMLRPVLQYMNMSAYLKPKNESNVKLLVYDSIYQEARKRGLMGGL